MITDIETKAINYITSLIDEYEEKCISVDFQVPYNTVRLAVKKWEQTMLIKEEDYTYWINTFKKIMKQVDEEKIRTLYGDNVNDSYIKEILEIRDQLCNTKQVKYCPHCGGEC